MITVDSKNKLLMTILLEFPFSIIQRTYLTSFQPSRNTMKVESVIADSPSHGAFLTGRRCLICLTFDTEIHDMISANRTVVYHDIPSPQSDGIPFLHFESFPFSFGSTGRRLLVVLIVDFHFCAHNRTCTNYE